MRLTAYSFKFASTGTSLTGVPVLDLVKDGIGLKIKKEVLEFVQSSGVSPSLLLDVGFEATIKAVIQTDSLSRLSESIRGTYANLTTYETLTLSQTVQEALKYDLQFIVKTLGDFETYKFTKVFINADLDAKFKVGSSFFVPLEFISSKETVFTINKNIT